MSGQISVLNKKTAPGNKDAGHRAPESGDTGSPPCYQHELDPSWQEIDARDWDSVRQWRKTQRARLALQRDNLDVRQREALSASVIRNLHDAFDLEARTVAFYWPLGSEIDLRPLMGELAGKGVTVALPAIAGRQEPLEFRRWRPGDELDDSGLWNIPTPRHRELVVPTLLCVPMLGFDEACHRLGYGGGFYDRTLAVPGFSPATVGIAYDFGRLRSIYPQAHDIAMQAIVTERLVLHRKSRDTRPA